MVDRLKASSSIKWCIVSPTGTTYGEEKTGETSEFEFKDLGEYILQCIYGSRLFLSQEKVQKKIEVIDNKIENASIQGGTILESGKHYQTYIKSGVKLSIGTLIPYEYASVSVAG